MRLPFFEGMPKENVTSFVNTLTQVEAKIPGKEEGLPSAEEVQTFIGAHDSQGGPQNTGDDKLGAAELAAALNIPLADAELFVSTFNQPQRGVDEALDAVELRDALDKVDGDAPTEGGEQTGGGEKAGGGEQAGGSESSGGGGGASAGGMSGLFSLLLQIFDADGDGKLDADELDALYERFDRNGNGTLELSEFTDGIKAEAAAKGVTAPSDAEINEMFSSLTGGGNSLAKADFVGGVNNGLEGGSE
jgi:hypothetical protein